MIYLLDTHVWIWLNLDPARLSPRIQKLFRPESSKNFQFLLSTISIVELATLVEKKRFELFMGFDKWVSAALDSSNLRVVEMSQDVARETGRLAGFTHYDPADRIIVATARLENATIITADRVLQAYRGVKTLW